MKNTVVNSSLLQVLLPISGHMPRYKGVTSRYVTTYEMLRAECVSSDYAAVT